MQHRTVVIAASLALLLIVGSGLGVWASRARSQQVNMVTVNGEGIPLALYNDAKTQEAVLSERYPGYFKRFSDINRLIDDMLIEQEAERRGIACSPQDASNFIATQVALATQANRTSDLVRDADVFGVMPPGWAQTPESVRTPNLPDAIATWQVNPSVVRGYQDICTTGRLYAAVKPPGANNDQRNAAIDQLMAQLRRNARIVGPATAPTETPTPAP